MGGDNTRDIPVLRQEAYTRGNDQSSLRIAGVRYAPLAPVKRSSETRLCCGDGCLAEVRSLNLQIAP